MSSVELTKLSMTFMPDLTVLQGIDLRVEDGELMVLVGPSGCGKTTLLRLVAGLAQPTSGTIRIGGADVTAVPPQDRNVGMVFQSYALYSHLSVYDNLAFPLRVRGLSAREITPRVKFIADLLGMTHLLSRRPTNLSGGEQQRVALGKAVVRKAACYLLDEPLSNVDVHLRAELRVDIRRLQAELSATILYVTHDQHEALTLGQRVAVLSRRGLEQVGSPRDVYEMPINAWVASFLGTPAINLMPAGLREDGNRHVCVAEGVDVQVCGAIPHVRTNKVLLGIRPHHIRLVEGGAAGILATVSLVEYGGERLDVHLLTQGGSPVLVRVDPSSRVERGQTFRLVWDPSTTLMFSAEDGHERLVPPPRA